MKLKAIKFMVVLTGVIVVATTAVAADEIKGEGKALKVANADVMMSGSFRTEWSHTTNGLGKVNEGGKDKKSAVFGVEHAKLGIGGKLNSDVDFKLQLNLLSSKWALGNSADFVEAAYGVWAPSKMFGVTMGKARVNQDGYNGKDSGEYGSAWGKSSYTGPFKTYAPMLAIHLNPGDMGKISLQLTNDVTTGSGPDYALAAEGKAQSPATTTNRPGKWNGSNKQPAAILQYTGEFGPMTPMVQIGQYDLNHSRFINVGTKFAVADLGVTFDYLLDNESQKVAKTAGGFEGKNLTRTNIALRTEYTMKGIAKPFLWVNSFNRSGEKENIALDEVKGNDNPSTSVMCGGFKQCFDDNALSISVGSQILAMGDGWSPYVVYRATSGKFSKLTGTETATGSTSTIAIGAGGAF